MYAKLIQGELDELYKRKRKLRHDQLFSNATTRSIIEDCPRKTSWKAMAEYAGISVYHLKQTIKNYAEQKRVQAQIYLLERKLEEMGENE